MELADFTRGLIDWSTVEPTTLRGASGIATQRMREFGRIRVRMVEYGSGYLADHWCSKGHVIHVVAGALILQFEDGAQAALTSGTTFLVPDDQGPPHRVLTETTATAFIAD